MSWTQQHSMVAGTAKTRHGRGCAGLLDGCRADTDEAHDGRERTATPTCARAAARAGWRDTGVGRSLVRSSPANLRGSLQQSCTRSSRPGTVSPGSPGGRREADISAQHSSPCQEARLSCSDEHPRRARRAQEPSRQGPRPSVGLIHGIRERRAFDRLAAHGARIRRTTLWCTWCPDPDSTATHVAFAFGRAFGPAVRRTTMRRRIRAILHEIDRQSPLPPGLLMIGGRPELIELTFDRLTNEVTSLIDQIRSVSPPVSAR